MKAVLLATARMLGAPAIAYDSGNAPPTTGDQPVPIPSGVGAQTSESGAALPKCSRKVRDHWRE